MKRPRARALVPACAVALVLGGCASAPPAAPGAAADAGASAAPLMGTNPADPWEAWNRKVFAFNDALDDAVLRPVAQTYRDAVPQLVRTGIDNVLGNIGDAWSMVNHLLQGKLQTGVEMGIRFVTNTVFGLGGVLDPATEMRLPRRAQDFGITLGHWGVGPGPYVVLPLFGPRTVRDTFGLATDSLFDPARLPETTTGRWSVLALEVVNTRANLLATTQLLAEAALDRYSFARDAYLARRLDAVHDGAPPMEQFDDGPDEPQTPAARPAAPASAPPRP